MSRNWEKERWNSECHMAWASETIQIYTILLLGVSWMVQSTACTGQLQSISKWDLLTLESWSKTAIHEDTQLERASKLPYKWAVWLGHYQKQVPSKCVFQILDVVNGLPWVKILQYVAGQCHVICKGGSSSAQACFPSAQTHSDSPTEPWQAWKRLCKQTPLRADSLLVPLSENLVQGLILCTEWA